MDNFQKVAEPSPTDTERRREWWQQQLQTAQSMAYKQSTIQDTGGDIESTTIRAADEPKTISVLGGPIYQPKNWLDSLSVFLSGGNKFKNLWKFGALELEGTTWAAMPKEQIAAIQQQATADLDEVARAKFMSDFYNNMDMAVMTGVTSADDYIKKFYPDDPAFLSQADRDEMGVAMSVLTGKVEGNVPDWLNLDEEKQQEVREFLAQTPKQPELSLQRMTVNELLKSLQAPYTVKLPEGWTIEEMLRYCSLMDLPPETVSQALDIDTAVSVYREAALEWEEYRQGVLSGIQEWEVPEQSFWDKAFFMVQSPMQLFADILKPYIHNVSYPLSGLVATQAGKLLSVYNIDRAFEQNKASGMSAWKAAGMAWQEHDIAWYYKLPFEIAFDPLTYLPGWGLSKPAWILNKLGMVRLAKSLTAVNKGLYAALDVPFSAVKYYQTTKMLKTTSQLMRAQSDEFLMTLQKAVSIRTGKAIHQFTVDDLATTLTEARKAFAENPRQVGDTMSDLGELLSRHMPLNKTQVYQWSKSHSGELIESMDDAVVAEVDQIIGDLIMKVNTPAEAAARMADALAITRTQKVMNQLEKEIPVYGAKRAINIESVIKIGQSSDVGGVERMMNYLVTRQKAINTARATGPLANAGFLSGLNLALVRTADKIENNNVRNWMMRYMVRPTAEAALGNIAYPIWNAFEGIAVTMIEGVTPRFLKQEAYNMMVKGLMSDPKLTLRLGSEPTGLAVREGIHLLPQGKILGWLGQNWIELSDWMGTAIRRNFIVEKMAQNLAERCLTLADGNVMRALEHLSTGAPKIARQSLGITTDELEKMMFRALSSSVDDVLALKKVLTDGSLMSGEVTKILRKCEFLSPRAKALGEELVQQGKVFKPGVAAGDSLDDFIKQITNAAIDDLKKYPASAVDNFRYVADQVDALAVRNSDDLMDVFQAYEYMSETASFIPHRMMSQAKEDADLLYAAKKFGDAKELLNKARADMVSSMDNIESNMARVRSKLVENSTQLTEQQRLAMESVLERAQRSAEVRQNTLLRDGDILDTFFSRPKSGLTPDDYNKLRADRAELWETYRAESAIPSAGEFITRRDLAKLYHDLPEPKLNPVDATYRDLSIQDVANVMGVNADGLISGLMDNISMHGKPYFIQLIRQSADGRPNLFKGFTDDKIAKVYDQIIASARMRPNADIATEKILMQMEGMRQDLVRLKMSHALQPEEEKAIHAWIDRAAAGRAKIIGEQRVFTPESAVAEGYLVRASGGKSIWAPAGTGGGTWFTDDVGYAKTYGNRLSYYKMPDKVMSYDEAGLLDAIGKKSRDAVTMDDYEYLAKYLRDNGYNGLSVPSRAIPSKREYWIFDTPTDNPFVFNKVKLLTEAELSSVFKGYGGIVSQQEWAKVRQSALDDAMDNYYKAFADYTHENLVGSLMKNIYPYWGYQNYRWFYLARTALRHPGIPAAWGKYQNYGEYGFQPTAIPNIEMNPFIGSILGTTFTLTRFDFASYYDQLGFVGEMLDYSQRFGFYPGTHVQTPIALTPILSGRPAELSEMLPPIARTGINLLVASRIPGVANAATWLKDKVFHENFHEYYTATILSNKQIEAGGTLMIDPSTGLAQSGADIWFKKMRKEKLTPEEQQLWDESYREAAMIGVLRTQFPMFRMKTEEYKDAYAQVTTLIEEQLGFTEAEQKDMWRHHVRPTDVVGGLPPDLSAAMDQMWEWKIMMGRGSILLPPDASDLKIHIDEYWKVVKTFQHDRLTTQQVTDGSFLQVPGTTKPIDGAGWRQEYAENWSRYSSSIEDTKKTPRFQDIEELTSAEGQLAMAKRLGFNVAPDHPLTEAINLYFDIELKLKADPITGEEDWDYLGFWLQREAVRMALTEDQREEFDSTIRKYQTPMEETFRYVYNTYLRGYRTVTRVVFEQFNPEEQKLISEYYAKGTSLDRQREIEATQRANGNQLISNWNTQLSLGRNNLRQVSPLLDFYLYVFGYGTKPLTPASEQLVAAWEADRSSILSVTGGIQNAV